MRGEKKKREKNGSLTAASATKHTQMMHSTKKTKQGECEGVYERERQRIWVSLCVFVTERIWKMRVRDSNNTTPRKPEADCEWPRRPCHPWHPRELKMWGHTSKWQPCVHPSWGKREAQDRVSTVKGGGFRGPEVTASNPAGPKRPRQRAGNHTKIPSHLRVPRTHVLY